MITIMYSEMVKEGRKEGVYESKEQEAERQMLVYSCCSINCNQVVVQGGGVTVHT